ncbi:MAG: DUF1013 domain-containing protein [Alphaproteobacteria bacterium]|nr:DUF1013 domain-containing protein [Alphaproteobacteria bacterium]
MTAPLMPKATAVWLLDNTTLTFKQIARFCELHELEIRAIADGDVAANIVGMNPITAGQLTAEEIARCEADASAILVASEPEGNVKASNRKNKKVLSPYQRKDKPAAVLYILKHYPEIIDSQICKLVGTTVPTITSLREGTHKDIAEIKPKNPTVIGLCEEKDIEKALEISRKRNEPKKKVKKTKKKTTKKKTTKKTVAKKTVAKKKTTTKKVATKKTATKKATAKKTTAKKSAVKKTTAKKSSTKKTATKKTAAKKTATKKKTTKKADSAE